MSQTFTNEADKLYNKYIDELRFELYKNNFSDLEVKETVVDVTSQILELCEFKEHGVIGTDALRHVLNKLGTPKEISETLSSASGFMEETEVMDESAAEFSPQYLHFRVKHLIKLNKSINWLLVVYPIWLISSFIILLSDPNWDDLQFMYYISLVFYILIYGSSVLIWHIIHTSGLLVNNNLVRIRIRPLSRQLYLPILFVLTSFFAMIFDDWLIVGYILAEGILVGLVVYYIFIMNTNHSLLINKKR
jgi:hypothetical protein